MVDTRPGDRASAPRQRRQEQEPASAAVTEVAPDVIRMQLPVWMPGLGHVNMYGLVDERGLAVVDPGLPGPRSWSILKRRLRIAGFRVPDVHTVVVTHSHPDHFGAAGRLAKAADARLITHRAFETLSTKAPAVGPDEAAAAEREAASLAQLLDVSLEDLPDGAAGFLPHPGGANTPWANPTPWGERDGGPSFVRRTLIRAFRLLSTPPRPTHRVRHDDPVVLGGREWRAVYTPGHTADHLCLFDPNGGVLLAGDHVLPTITPHISGLAEGFDTLDAYLATLDLVADLPGVRRALPAHGHPFDDVPGRVAAIKRHHDERMAKLRVATAALGPASVRTLSHELFPKRYWGNMAESETFAHLQHLVHQGEAERSVDDGRFVFRLTGADTR